MFLGALPFLAVAIAYLVASGERLAVNPNDKLLPSPAQMWSAFLELATVPDKRSGDLILWVDTYASLLRLFAGVGAATLAALCFGIAIGFIPRVRAFLLALRHRRLRDPAAGAAADPVHRARPWRNGEDHADRGRRRAGDGARHRQPRHGTAARTGRQGADAWRQQLDHGR